MSVGLLVIAIVVGPDLLRHGIENRDRMFPGGAELKWNTGQTMKLASTSWKAAP